MVRSFTIVLIFFLISLLIVVSPLTCSANNFEYNQQTMDINQMRLQLDNAEKRSASPRERTSALLKARQLLQKIKGRATKHADTDSVVSRYQTLRKNMITEFFKQAGDNLSSETTMKTALSYIELLLKIDPSNKKFQEWKKNLTHKDRVTSMARVYDQEPNKKMGNRSEDKIRSMSDKAMESLLFRHMAEAEKAYRAILKIEALNVEAGKRLKTVLDFQTIEGDVKRLESLMTIYDPYSLTISQLSSREVILNKLESLDPDGSERKSFFHPIASSLIKEDPKKLGVFTRRSKELAENYFDHITTAALLKTLTNKHQQAEPYLRIAETINPRDPRTLKIRIAFDIQQGNLLNVLKQLKQMVRELDIAGGMFTFYMRLPLVTFTTFAAGTPNKGYWFVLRTHLPIYSKLFWPLIIVLSVQLSCLVWTGRKTYGIWDLATDGKLTKTLTLQNKEPIHFLDAANKALGQGKQEKALKNYNLAIEGDEYLAQARLGRGNLHYIMGQFKEAKDDLTVYLRIAPHEKRPLFLLALSLDKLNQRQEAILKIEEAIGLGTQTREFSMEEITRNHHRYRKVFNEYRRTAEKLLEA